MRKKRLIIVGIVLFILLLGIGLTFLVYIKSNSINLSALEALQTKCLSYDTNIIEKYRINGQQTQLSEDNIKIIETEINKDNNVIKMIKNVYEWEKDYFRSDHASGAYIGQRTVNDIFKDKVLTGCHDYGIVYAAVMRHFGIASLMVDTAAIQWAYKYHDGKTNDFSGHVFVEVYYDEKCVLVDPNFGKMIINYDPENPVIPTTFWPLDKKGFYVLYKGLDPLDYGITANEVLGNELRVFSSRIYEKEIIVPKYKIININYINLRR